MRNARNAKDALRVDVDSEAIRSGVVRNFQREASVLGLRTENAVLSK
jgi:hypothetical protein